MNKKIIILSFCMVLLFIPKAYADCEYRRLKETIYMNPNDWVLKCIYGYVPHDELRDIEGDTIKWSFRTYNSSFTVNVTSYESMSVISKGKTSDLGESYCNEFGFRNTDIVGGYIEIDIHVKEEETIDGYNSTVFLLILISMISVISIKKKVLKGRY